MLSLLEKLWSNQHLTTIHWSLLSKPCGSLGSVQARAGRVHQVGEVGTVGPWVVVIISNDDWIVIFVCLWWKPVLTATDMASNRRCVSSVSGASLQDTSGRRWWSGDCQVMIIDQVIVRWLGCVHFDHHCHDVNSHLWIVLGLRGEAGVHSVQIDAARWTHLRS